MLSFVVVYLDFKGFFFLISFLSLLNVVFSIKKEPNSENLGVFFNLNSLFKIVG